MKIVLYEDYDKLRDVIRACFEAAEHTVTIVEGPEIIIEELVRAKDEPYDAVVTANGLGHLHVLGIDAIRAIRADPRFTNLRIILYTGSENPRLEAEAKKLNVIFLPKLNYSAIAILEAAEMP